MLDPYAVHYKVPQCSILFTVLFNIYMKPLREVICLINMQILSPLQAHWDVLWKSWLNVRVWMGKN